MIVGLGEALWDVFPDRECFGGAPANFACMAAELGGDRAEVHMVTGVGDDDHGHADVRRQRRAVFYQQCRSPCVQGLVEIVVSILVGSAQRDE